MLTPPFSPAYSAPAAITRTAASMGIGRPHFERVMMDQAIVGSSGNPPSSEPITANREYSGSTTGATAPTTSDLSCTEQLTDMENDGTVPTGESCTCPTDATTPQCLSAADASQACQTALTTIDESSTADSETCTCQPGDTTPSCVDNSTICAQGLQQQETIYNTCSCAANATSPVCESYYQICEGNLSASETANPDSSCSCDNPSTTATPTCVYDYDACAALATTYEASNPDEVCTCPATGTNSTSFTCQTDYQVCEENIGEYETGDNVCTCSDTSTTPSCQTDYAVCNENVSQYETSDTTCQCSQTSTEPYCCTSTTAQACVTTNEYTSVNNCANVSTWSCVMPDEGSISDYAGLQCIASDWTDWDYDGELEAQITSSNLTVPASYCGSGQVVLCWWNYNGSPADYAQANLINVQQCNPTTVTTPVTTCNPVTTQSCKSD